MKSLTEYLTINSDSRRDYINITAKIEDLVKKSGIKEGLCLVNAMHITASVFINDAENGLIKDFDDFLDNLLVALVGVVEMILAWWRWMCFLVRWRWRLIMIW